MMKRFTLKNGCSAAAAVVLAVALGGCGGSKAPNAQGDSKDQTKASVTDAGQPVPASSSNAQLRGIRIVGPVREGEGQEMRAFNWFPGTSVSIWLSVPQGGIIACDHNKSTLEVFKDDRGTDLLTAPKLGKFSQSGLDMMPNISPDGKALVFEAKAGSKPAKDATRLTVSGKLHLKLATKKKTVRTEKITLAKGTKFKLGDWNFEVKEAGKPQWGGDQYKYSVTLHLKQDLSALADLHFIDAAGKKLEVHKGGGSSSSFGNNVSIDRSFLFKEEVNAATLEAEVWTDMREQEVPFQASGGLGL